MQQAPNAKTSLQRQPFQEPFCSRPQQRQLRKNAVQQPSSSHSRGRQNLQQCRAYKRSFRRQRKQEDQDRKEAVIDVEIAKNSNSRPAEVNGNGVDTHDGFHEGEEPIPPVEHGDRLVEGISAEEVAAAGPTFTQIEMDGCDVLILTDSEGQLDLRSVYFRDHDLDIFAEPEVIGELPETLSYYAPSEWREEFTGDTLMEKDAWAKVLKVYLLKVDDPDPDHFRIDLETVYCLDSKTRTLKKEEVIWKTTERNIQNITLRVRPEGCTIEENSEMITEFDLVEDFVLEQELEKIRKAEESGWTQSGWAGGAVDEGMSGPRDPIDALNDDEREYDENFDDTPEVDQVD